MSTQPLGKHIANGLRVNNCPLTLQSKAYITFWKLKIVDFVYPIYLLLTGLVMLRSDKRVLTVLDLYEIINLTLTEILT